MREILSNWLLWTLLAPVVLVGGVTLLAVIAVGVMGWAVILVLGLPWWTWFVWLPCAGFVLATIAEIQE